MFFSLQRMSNKGKPFPPTRESSSLQCFLWPWQGGFLGPGEAPNGRIAPRLRAPRRLCHGILSLPRAKSSKLAPSRALLVLSCTCGAVPAWRRQQNLSPLLDVRCCSTSFQKSSFSVFRGKFRQSVLLPCYELEECSWGQI